ncbi:hypothetical protein LTR56_013508 [Elasticomyces elasticus]|nr:hypothetical protein LTR56_013508 [Elasticomyces elasticus]KAK3649525.1 hypothetical protein LTR22_012882 [Elasticomyces elasticus]KAK4933047.1 hypothetical protein LTR49_000531 [Elasticomyces elasticus]KAK5763946.1 hypothetical protein LTS12_005856 [Elasticomyces elasticus]
MLTVKRPTPTTVLYTVSTRNNTDATWTTRALQYGLLGFRLLAGLLVAVLVASEVCNGTFSVKLTGICSTLGARVYDSPVGSLVSSITHSFPWYYRAIAIAGIAWLVCTKSHTEESLLVIRGLGVQTSTSSPSYLWTSSTRFIPTSSIQDIFIYEAFKGFEVRYYLSIVVEDEEGVVVVFPVSEHVRCYETMLTITQSILPRRDVVEKVWRGTRSCLYEPKG